MSDTSARAPQVMEEQNLDTAKNILKGMVHYRIDPANIRMTDPTAGKRGGEGVVTIGTLSLPEVVKIFISRLKSSAEHLGLSPEQQKWLLPQMRGKFKEWPYGLPVDAAVEMLGMPPETFKDWLPETTVAVKSFEWSRGDAKESAKFFKSFVHELSLMAELCHPNIVQLVGFVENIEKGDAWMILSWEANGNVREFLQSGEWDLPERLSLIKDTAKGLEYLHNHQPPICHGDLKSLNILVSSSYRAVITDFGSARIRPSAASEKRDNLSELAHGAPVNSGIAAAGASPEITFNPSTLDLTLTGPKFSLRWIAPEVLNGGQQDLPSDLWAIGWICWEIITGKIPFEELSKVTAIILHTINGKLPAIRDDMDLSHVLKLCSLMSECWALEPSKRICASAFQRSVDMMPSETPSGCTSGGQKIRSAALLLRLGETYSLQSDRARGLSYYKSALDVATRTEDEAMKGNALLLLGRLYLTYNRLRPVEAEKAFMEAYEIYTRTGDAWGVANALEGLGSNYRVQSKYREAEKAFIEAHEMHSRIENNLGAATALDGLGHTYLNQSKNQEAENAFLKAHEMHSRIGNTIGAANALFGLGRIYLAMSKYHEAEKTLMEAHDLHSRIGDDLGAANALTSLGRSYQGQSKYGKAEKALKEAHEVHSRIGNNLGIVAVSNALGCAYRAQSKYQEAEEAFTEAYEMSSRIGNDLGAANALDGLGQLYYIQSKRPEAEKAFMEAHEVHSRIGDDLGAANALDGLGQLYYIQTKFPEAEKAFMESHEVHSRNGNNLGTANALVGLGHLHWAQSKYGEAEKEFMEAYQMHSRIGNELGIGTALTGLGDIYRVQSRHREAEKAFIEAYEMHSRIGSNLGTANALNGLGRIYLAQTKHREAGKAFLDAYEIHSRIGNDLGVKDALLGLGNSYRQKLRSRPAEVNAQKIPSTTGNTPRSFGTFFQDQEGYDEAEMSYRQALGAYDYANDVGSKARTLFILGQLHHAQAGYLDAEETVAEALAIWISLSNEESQAEAYMLMARIFAAQSRHAEVIDAIIQAKGAISRIESPLAHAQTLHDLGDFHLELDMYTEAEECYHLAQAILSSMDDTRGEAGELLGLGLLYTQQSRYVEAEECFVQARLAYVVVADEDGEAKALDILMGLYAIQRKLGHAKLACMEACKSYAQRSKPMSKMCVMIWERVQRFEEPPAEIAACEPSQA